MLWLKQHCRFMPANLEFMFSKYAREVPDKLSLRELWHMTEANRVAFDFFGWSSLFLFLKLFFACRTDVENPGLKMGESLETIAGLPASSSGECCIFLQKTNKGIWQKKPWGVALTGVCLSIVLNIAKVLLERWLDSFFRFSLSLLG